MAQRGKDGRAKVFPGWKSVPSLRRKYFPGATSHNFSHFHSLRNTLLTKYNIQSVFEGSKRGSISASSLAQFQNCFRLISFMRDIPTRFNSSCVRPHHFSSSRSRQKSTNSGSLFIIPQLFPFSFTPQRPAYTAQLHLLIVQERCAFVLKRFRLNTRYFLHLIHQLPELFRNSFSHFHSLRYILV
jgi:hypothetical protein